MHWRPFQNCLVFTTAGLLLADGQEPKPRPHLLVTPGTLRSNVALGSQVSQDLNRCWVRDGDHYFGFDPYHPTGPSLKVLSLEGVRPDAEVDVHGETVYQGDGREITRGLPGSPWFRPEQRFATFRILDDRHVALFWTYQDAGETQVFRRTTWDGEKLRAQQASFLEIWDATSKVCLHREPMPEALTGVLDLFREVRLGSIQTSHTCGHLFIYLPVLQQAYGFDTQEHKLTRLQTPWPSLEADWLKRAIQRNPGATAFTLLQGQLPGTTLSVSPGEAGELLLGYSTALTRKEQRHIEQSLQPMLPKGAVPLVPPLEKEGSATFIHLASWKPGRGAVEEVSATGHPTLEDFETLNQLGWWGDLQGGLYATPDRKVMPYSVLVKQIRETRAERLRQAAETAKAPKRGAEAPKPTGR